MGSLIVAIAVVISVAYLLWQVWEADLIDQR
jgi:hypothetical protein